MQAILPGRPQSKLQAIDTGVFEDQSIVVYISGKALVILTGPQSLAQTIYHDDAGDQGLQAVIYHGATGKIAAAAMDRVYIYGLEEEVKGTLLWQYEKTITITPSSDGLDAICCLSWGSDEELLVGSHSLTLFSTHVPSRPTSAGFAKTVEGFTKPIWSIPLPSTVRHAALSPSASLIATSAAYDCLVKIWRRLSFESPEFEYAYLRHPASVTHLEWRSTGLQDEQGSRGENDKLYTVCADGKFRVWANDDAHNHDILCLLAEIDMVTAIQPRDATLLPASNVRHVFTMPWTMLQVLLEQKARDGPKQTQQDRHALEYVKEITSRRPDLVIVLDDQGHMSAWGIENVGCKRRNSDVNHASPFLVAHVDSMDFGFLDDCVEAERYACIRTLFPPDSDGHIAILSHHFDGRLIWQQISLQDLVDPSAKRGRFRHTSLLTGHSNPIKKIIRTAGGEALVSRTSDNQCIVWRQVPVGGPCLLQRQSAVHLQEHIHRLVLLKNGDFVVFLHHNSISVWDTRHSQAAELARCSYKTPGKPLCLIVVPAAQSALSVHVVTVTSEMDAIAWRITLPPHVHDSSQIPSNGHVSCAIQQVDSSQLDSLENVSYVLAVDPAGGSRILSDSLDTFSQDVALSYTTTGTFRTHAARVTGAQGGIEFLTTATVETGILEPAFGSATSIHKAALVDRDRTTLTVWDTKSGRRDHEQRFENQPIQDLDWASTPDMQSILAVGFTHRILIFTQLRYDYVTERPSWTSIKEVSTRDLTPHPIGDSVWFSNGSLVIGAGNALFIGSNTVSLSTDLSPELHSVIPHKGAARVFDLVSGLNGPLCVFHPQFIAQCVLSGKLELVQHILVALARTLKFYTEGDPIDPLLGFHTDQFTGEHGVSSTAHSRHIDSDTEVDSAQSVTEEIAETLTSLLSEKSVPQLSSEEQLGMVNVIQCIAIMGKHRRSIDDNAARYLLFWRQAIMRSHQTSKNQQSSERLGAVSWREIVWAQHSSSQDILVDLISRQHLGRMSWQQARDAGVFVWLSDRTALLAQFESIARNAYTATEPKDPVSCSLYYLTLRKKAVLVGLWRMATWSREQAATMKLLRNDFTEPRWKTAAAKNAYALMGKRRFEYAAAMFLLADDLKSAVSVLSNQLGDVQLAVAVARVYGGDDGPVLQGLLREKVLPLAISRGNRWQATWALWLLGDRSSAVRALVSPMHELAQPPIPQPELQSAKSFLNDDPALVVAYRQLREKSLQTLRGAIMVKGHEEWAFVIKTATLLRRMGCDLLALDLVRNWDFLKGQTVQKGATVADQVTDGQTDLVAELPKSPRNVLDDYDIVPAKLLRRRSSLVVADLPILKNSRSPVTKPQGSQVASMLDGYDMKSTTEAKPRLTETTGFKREEENSSLKATNSGKVDSKSFKEPDSDSLLSSFGF